MDDSNRPARPRSRDKQGREDHSTRKHGRPLVLEALGTPMAAQEQAISSLPRFPPPQPRVHRRPSRPTTASAAEEPFVLLPAQTISVPKPEDADVRAERGIQDDLDDNRTPPARPRLQDMEKWSYQGPAENASDLEYASSDVQTEPEKGALVEADYDWATFIGAYAAGRWDPRKTPNPPRSHLLSSLSLYPSTSEIASTRPISADSRREDPSFPSSVSSHSAPSLVMDSDDDCLPGVGPSGTPIAPNGAEENDNTPGQVNKQSPSGTSPPTSEHSPGESKSDSESPPTSRKSSAEGRPGFPKSRFARPGPGRIALPTFRLRNSMDMRSGLGDTATPAVTTDQMTSAAAIRWAAARVSLAPLALPSPEHELTDPMRGVTTAIPGSHAPDSPLPTPGGTRLTKFWMGTQEIEDALFEPSVEASPANSPSHPPSPLGHEPTSAPSVSTSVRKQQHSPHTRRRSSMPLASAPIFHTSEPANEDYFGDVGGSGSGAGSGSGGTRATSRSRSHSRSDSVVRSAGSQLHRRDTAPPDLDIPVLAPTTVPAVPRRVCLTRQSSSPLPNVAALLAGRALPDGFLPHRMGRAVKEEQMFTELGYLAPPMAPDELERRRALFKFNIWNTGHDPNFDRIVHLAKLVFNTKCVVISLTDGNVEWFKAQSGMNENTWPRASSLCAHAILQRGDEPMVILDTHEDWRFAKNPLVLGSPKMRFYSGAPLRTQDGYNIGSLSVFDDSPRTDFTPRQRHTLKEFAAIAVRELELWRDKIQLRIRDRIQNSMEQFTRECLEIDNENTDKKPSLLGVGTSMEKVYERAARLVKKTLDVEGAIVLDVSHSETLETFNAEGVVSIAMHKADAVGSTENISLTAEEYMRLTDFFTKHPDGKISEGVAPVCLRGFLPTQIQYSLAVPILNVDKRPFALLCAYNASEHTKRYLEGHELSYLRAIGVIILSAVLKRRMILADKAKSLFISNISHELRTPLHGILAAAELLADSSLDHSQMSFLQTVQACGTSLVETVNHVLDFTKLSGNAKSGGVDNVIRRSRVDLMQLVEEAVEGCWIGYKARMSALPDSDIGSVYAPPRATAEPSADHVEIIVDINRRPGGWIVKCEKGGIRRILMNIFSNSLKFTSHGYVHVVLRDLPPSADEHPQDKLVMELSVLDTGKGISQDFLKNQLFHPFSQENPLQTGTGLGLAIVSSIVRSSSVDGSIDVSSAEGVGTEIRVTFTAEYVDDPNHSSADMEPFSFDDFEERPTISLIGFQAAHRGVEMLRNVLSSYLLSWGLEIRPESARPGEIALINEDPSLVIAATQRKDPTRPYIILTENRGSAELMGVVTDYETIGGFARLVYKPGGPSRIRSAIKLCLHALNMGQRSRASSLLNLADMDHQTKSALRPFMKDLLDPSGSNATLSRRNSDEANAKGAAPPKRPHLGPRAFTVHAPTVSWNDAPDSLSDSSQLTAVGFSKGHARRASALQESNSPQDMRQDLSSEPTSPTAATIDIGSGGTLLKSSVGSFGWKGTIRVLVVEDNTILRNLLVKWLKTKGYDYREAVDGRDGVNTFQSGGNFDVVLLDLSMPILDGIGATAEIRQIEAARDKENADSLERRVRILALTGMSSLDDKRRAFEAGVDGYLVKPVAFKTLDSMFHKMGLS